MMHIPHPEDSPARAPGAITTALASQDDPWQARTAILLGWLACDPLPAWEYYTRHSAILRDPRTIAMLCWFVRQCEDPVEATVLQVRRDWLLHQRRE